MKPILVVQELVRGNKKKVALMAAKLQRQIDLDIEAAGLSLTDTEIEYQYFDLVLDGGLPGFRIKCGLKQAPVE